MTSQPTGNRSQFAGDDSTRLLAPVGKGDAVRYVVGRSGVKGRNFHRRAPWQARFEQDAANIRSDFDAALTAVIPKVEHGHMGDIPRHPVFQSPANPQPIVNGEPYNDHPWCRKRLVAIAVIFGSGAVFGAFVATWMWWF